MKKAEIVIIALFIISIVLGAFRLPGSSMFIILSLTALSALYFYFGFALFNHIRFRDILKKESYKNVSVFLIISAIITGFALSTVVVGIMFSLLYWPRSSIMMVVGIMPIPVIIIVALVKYLLTKAKYYIGILVRTILFGSIALFLIIYPNFWIEFKWRDNPEYLEYLLHRESVPDEVK